MTHRIVKCNIYLCSICETRLSRNEWYCYSCYQRFKIDIESKQPWCKFLQNEEKRRRRKTVGMDCIGETEDGVIWQVENRKTMS